MNIFAISYDPVECAVALDDKRLVKMILETAQLINNHTGEFKWRPTHLHHPCSKWAESKRHRIWLQFYLIELCKEYTHRYGRHHMVEAFTKQWVLPKEVPWVVFVNVSPFGHANVTEAYRECLREKWNLSSPRWTKRRPPVWWKDKLTKAGRRQDED